MTSRRILITGARGYLGGRLVRHLVSTGHTVVGTSRAATSTPAAWPAEARLLQLDPLGEAADAREILREVDCVIHLAAANEWRSIADPDAALIETGSGTRRMLEAAIAANVRRFVFLSTVHVYGAPLDGVLSEDRLPQPSHPYAITHLAAEAFVSAADVAGRIEGVNVRLSNGIGAPAWMNVDRWTLVGNDLARQAVETGEIVVRSPDQWRDFIPLADVCTGLEMLSVTAPHTRAQTVFNLAAGVAMQVGTIAQRTASLAREVTGRPVSVRGAFQAADPATASFRIPIDRMKAFGYVPSGSDVLDREIAETITLIQDRQR
ncbi:NAD-dependent epimerase/dehydratase family protein [Methylobacterium indicum]|uniref:NAD-dependent epimerase/dehydratase family protein n=1 Tax=Methylobacterium indicum TaxID=1775910 RepID=UPI0009E2ADAC|nr:SDR family oxidoreductase [Methylobacterium indicum]